MSISETLADTKLRLKPLTTSWFSLQINALKLSSALFLILLVTQPLLAQSSRLNRVFDEQKDSAFAVLFSSLWIELELTQPSKDTVIVLNNNDEAFYYRQETIFDSSLAEKLVIRVPKYANIASRYFENKTEIKRPVRHYYFATPYLTYEVIRKWEAWYRTKRNSIDYLTFLEEMDKLKQVDQK
jgi:hypothetical protein